MKEEMKERSTENFIIWTVAEIISVLLLILAWFFIIVPNLVNVHDTSLFIGSLIGSMIVAIMSAYYTIAKTRDITKFFTNKQ